MLVLLVLLSFFMFRGCICPFLGVRCVLDIFFFVFLGVVWSFIRLIWVFWSYSSNRGYFGQLQTQGVLWSFSMSQGLLGSFLIFWEYFSYLLGFGGISVFFQVSGVFLLFFQVYGSIDHLIINKSLHKYKCLQGVADKGRGSSLQEGVSHTYTLKLCQSRNSIFYIYIYIYINLQVIYPSTF